MLKYVTMFAAALSVCVSAYADDEATSEVSFEAVASNDTASNDAAEVAVEAPESNSGDTSSAE